MSTYIVIVKYVRETETQRGVYRDSQVTWNLSLVNNQ